MWMLGHESKSKATGVWKDSVHQSLCFHSSDQNENMVFNPKMGDSPTEEQTSGKCGHQNDGLVC